MLWLQNGRVESQACAFHYAPSDTAFSPAGDTEFPYNRVLIGVGIAWIVVASLVVAYALATFALGVYHFYEHAYPEERTWRNFAPIRSRMATQIALSGLGDAVQN